MGERLSEKQEVAGSMPAVGTIYRVNSYYIGAVLALVRVIFDTYTPFLLYLISETT